MCELGCARKGTQKVDLRDFQNTLDDLDHLH